MCYNPLVRSARFLRALRTMCAFCIPVSVPGPARQAVLLTPPRFLHPGRLLSSQRLACVSPLAATLIHLPASVANKRLAARLSPLAATLTKNTEYLLQAKSLSLSFSRCSLQLLSVPPSLCGCRSASHLPYPLPSSVSCNSFVCSSYENTGGVGVFFPFRHSSLAPWHSSLATVPNSFSNTPAVGEGPSFLISLPPYFLTSLLLPVTSHESPVTNRCIISPREHPAERSRMPRPGLPHRKGNHYCRILPTLPERPGQRLQSEVESRSGHESRRSRCPASPAFSRRPIPGPLRQRFGQPCHQVRTPPPGSFQLLSPRNCHSLRLIAARSPNSGRASHPRRTHAYLRRPERRAIQLAAFDEARAPARQSSSAPARHQGVSLRASFVRRRRSI